MKRAGVAVDVGGTKIVSAASNAPEAVYRMPTKVEEGADGVCRQILDALRHWGVIPGERIVVASAGHLDMITGRVIKAANLPLQDYPLVEHLAEATGCHVELIGDATAATIAELTHPSRARHRNGLYVTVSTGVGMGVMRDHKLDWLAGIGDRELGHVRVDSAADAELCGCRRRGCLEAYGAGLAVLRRYATAVRLAQAEMAAVPTSRSSPVTVTDVEKAAQRGDSVAREVLDQALRHLTTAISQAVAKADATMLVLGGGVMVHSGLFEPLRERLRATAGERLVIGRSVFGEYSPVRGAAAICERAEDVMTALGRE